MAAKMIQTLEISCGKSVIWETNLGNNMDFDDFYEVFVYLQNKSLN